MHTTMITPVMPSTPLTNVKYVGFISPKYWPKGAYFSSDDFINRGKSHTRWFPAWRIIPTTIAAAITLWKLMLSSKGSARAALVLRNQVMVLRHTGRRIIAIFSFRVSAAPFAVVTQ
ncbi:Os01g0734399 [Oryza sativa Japonica Group]|uniref:Os01g0734399 protein n=1 Tax=Oryza sativa subsp. japonica TaxID=39947 RepID=A0A0P0V7V2_ORYSJ|nr:hypothetical protein EE612_005552 [Oryza sativa]BAS74215.1 Os01g0734399 [Oryza sativa Japonica Group]